jgi:hypothetical protein
VLQEILTSKRKRRKSIHEEGEIENVGLDFPIPYLTYSSYAGSGYTDRTSTEI